MLAAICSLITSRTGLIGVAIALVLGIIGAQTLRVAHAKADLAHVQADLLVERRASDSLRAAVTSSEQRRATEYAAATASLDRAESACAARVIEARRSAGKIRTLLETPDAVDPIRRCPVRALLDADELRDALRPGA